MKGWEEVVTSGVLGWEAGEGCLLKRRRRRLWVANPRFL
jgi:hypothetical protein